MSVVAFLVLYVNAILLIGNDIPTLLNIKSWLGKCFSMKGLGEVAYILGIKIPRDRSKRLIGLSQSAYIEKVLKRFSMQESKKGFLPMSHGINLSKTQFPNTKDKRDCMSKISYALTIGSIVYAMLCTRLDVFYALSITSIYQSDPSESHWTAVKNILKYLKRSKDMFLVYGITQMQAFKPKKMISDHSQDIGYISASDAAKEVIWIKKFISDLGVVLSITNPVDNIERGDVKICKVPTDDNVADHLTKPLPQAKHDRYARFIGMRYINNWA
ncbi:polyprotein [Gossypium australe]|uniref:Polyprotein n=1 Tax=Gossypium australe TaxID=47621 RepID=A0A5B6V9W5_9ROSI|nr:polyprotein [Gossypium australe]